MSRPTSPPVSNGPLCSEPFEFPWEDAWRAVGAGAWFWEIPTGRCGFDDGSLSMLGRTQVDVTGHIDEWRSWVHPDDAARVQHHLQAHLSGRTEGFDQRMRLLKADGGWCWVECRGRVTRRDADGQPLQMWAVQLDVHRQVEAERQAQEATLLLQETVNTLPGIVYRMVWNPDRRSGCVEYISPGVQALLGVTPEAVCDDQRVLFDRIVVEDRRTLFASMQASLEAGDAHFRHLHRARPLRDDLTEGPVRWIQMHATVHRLPNGAVRTFGSSMDVTSLVQTTRALEATQTQTEALLRAMPDLLLVLDAGRRYKRIHAPQPEWLLAPEAQMLGLHVAEVLPHAAQVAFVGALDEALATERPARARYSLTLQGEDRWFELVAALVQGPGSDYLCLVRDITPLLDSEARLRRSRSTDALTGLSNRQAFMPQLQQRLESADGPGQVLVMLDVDRFRDINDAWGHEVGDAFLTQLVQRLVSVVGQARELARVGPDEWVWLPPPSCRLGAAVATATDVDDWCRRWVAPLLEAANTPLSLPVGWCTSSVSVGVAVAEPGTGADALFQQVETAMFHAKQQGGHRWVVYDPAQKAALVARHTLLQDLRLDVAAGRLDVHYQPIVNAQGQTLGAEALLRWPHRTRGFVSPAEFIPLAESTDLILQMGQWVLAHAARVQAAWAASPHTAAWFVAVNISARQLHHPRFVQDVLDTVAAHGANPRCIKLELTESLLQHNMGHAVAVIRDLRAHGFQLALDDFGTGFSSLGVLKHLPIDQLKIDRSFVSDLLLNDDAAAIARMVLQLADTLRLTTVAEGVETPEQMAFLRAMGCPLFQGYLFGRPRPIQDWPAPGGVPGGQPAEPGISAGA